MDTEGGKGARNAVSKCTVLDSMGKVRNMGFLLF